MGLTSTTFVMSEQRGSLSQIVSLSSLLLAIQVLVSLLFIKAQILPGKDVPLTILSHEVLRVNEFVSHPELRGKL